MAGAFSWLGMFGAADYMALRLFLLEELRSAGSHALQIDTELRRIGVAEIMWATDGKGNATETREGFIVRPAASSIGKLLKAYIAQGGNPFDICMYLNPRSGVSFQPDPENPEELKIVYNQPYGGCLTVKTRENPTDPFDAGGELIWHKNPRLRTGKTQNQDRAEPVGVQVASARKWANQAIREKRSDIEWQILKLLDLSEQLVIERIDTLGHALAGMVPEVVKQDDIATTFTMKEHLATLDRIVFEIDPENDLPVFGKLNVQNFQKGFYDFLTPPRQKGEDDWVGGKIPDGLKLEGQDRQDVVADLAAPPDGHEVDGDA